LNIEASKMNEDERPAELMQFCDEHQMEVLRLLALIASMSELQTVQTLPNTPSEDCEYVGFWDVDPEREKWENPETFQKAGQKWENPETFQIAGAKCAVPRHSFDRVYPHYFSYFLGCAKWIADKHEIDPSLGYGFGRSAVRCMPSGIFTPGKASERICNRICTFYSNEKNVDRASNYCGVFHTSIPLEELALRIKDGLINTGMWGEWQWNDELHEKAMRSWINEKFVAPLTFYAEEEPITREFWNFAIIASIATSDCRWRMWPGAYCLLGLHLATLRKSVLAMPKKN